MEELLVMTERGTLENVKIVLCRLLELFEENGFRVSRVSISVHLFLLLSEKVSSIFIWLLLHICQFLILYKMISV